MNANYVRTNSTVLDGWPVLLAFSLYLMAFYIFAKTMNSVFLVA
jgi:hypothetical protein